jgi:hypothetical protein
MPSESKDTIIIRVKPAVKRAARRGAKANICNLTDYIVDLITKDDESRQEKERVHEPA